MDPSTVLQKAIMKSLEDGFTPPPEAPVFEPTTEEFADPLGYIFRIKPVAEKTGICKIKPPPGWQPPFSLDVDKLKFVPRIQKINELEATTRLKLHFLEKVLKFWEMQGNPLKLPTVEGKTLDLYCLRFWVQEEGGFENCCTNKKWKTISINLGYSVPTTTSYIIKGHYERILLPYDIFQKNKHLEQKKKSKEKKYKDVKNEESDDEGYFQEVNISTIPKIDFISPDIDNKRNETVSKMEYKSNIHKTKTGSQIKNDVELELDPNVEPKCSRELKRLQCFGAGPKMPGCVNSEVEEEELSTKFRKRAKMGLDPLADYYCLICEKDYEDKLMLICNGCDDTYHTFCLSPPLSLVPEGDWRCPPCIADEVKKPMEAFGFAQAEREYTLHEFGLMADKFKLDYFRRPGHSVSTSEVEREFWKIIRSTDNDVTVEYGADLHSMDHGSGFPTMNSLNLDEADRIYANSGWNLNNLPVIEGSVLRYINTDISGMTVPWMYVGMCFAAFCWHNEDHWSYSINFLHWGEPKTWYGVPSGSADLLERTMKQAAPELFQSQPDLLHQLVTTMNPNLLMDLGVPVYRLDQGPGEFVITFPRAYHTGFNQGYNFAEAVNFAPADWLPVGRECIMHYKKLGRFCVFSHEELICKMALEGDRLDLTSALNTHTELTLFTNEEGRYRTALLDRGVRNVRLIAFEKLGDDERLCEVCKTTCFLSSVYCNNCGIMVCLSHSENVCSCPVKNLTLNYRYDMDELHIMLQTLEFRIKSFDNWITEAKQVIFSKNIDQDKLRRVLEDAGEINIPKCSLLNKLKAENRKMNDEIEIIEIDDD